MLNVCCSVVDGDYVHHSGSSSLVVSYSLTTCVVSSVRGADYYMQEAKRLKHKADALVRCSPAKHASENQSGRVSHSSVCSRWSRTQTALTSRV